MPPQGKEEPLTEKELKNLRDWIQSGAKQTIGKALILTTKIKPISLTTFTNII